MHASLVLSIAPLRCKHAAGVVAVETGKILELVDFSASTQGQSKRFADDEAIESKRFAQSASVVFLIE